MCLHIIQSISDQLLRKLHHARTTRTLILVVLCTAPSGCTVANSEFVELRYLWTAIAALTVAFIVHILIPLVRSFYDAHRSKQHYFSYLWVNVTHTLHHYGAEEAIPVSELSYPDRNITQDDWYLILKEAGLEPPSLLSHLADRLLVAEFDDADYIPYITYVGFQTVVLDHEHPIWGLNAGVKTISAFLATQAHCKAQIQYLYEKPFYNLITEPATTEEQAKANKHRWLNGAEAVMCDLAENYVAAVRLRNFLEAQGAGSFQSD